MKESGPLATARAGSTAHACRTIAAGCAITLYSASRSDAGTSRASVAKSDHAPPRPSRIRIEASERKYALPSCNRRHSAASQTRFWQLCQSVSRSQPHRVQCVFNKRHRVKAFRRPPAPTHQRPRLGRRGACHEKARRVRWYAPPRPWRRSCWRSASPAGLSLPDGLWARLRLARKRHRPIARGEDKHHVRLMKL
jgi:hypothetical protein